MAEDALNAKKMNVNPGGKQPLMRAGWFVRNRLRFKQHMVFTSGPRAGQPKGLKVVCEERFGDEKIKGLLGNKYKTRLIPMRFWPNCFGRYFVLLLIILFRQKARLPC